MPTNNTSTLTTGIVMERYGRVRIINFIGYSSTNGAISPQLSEGDIPKYRIHNYILIGSASNNYYLGYVENTSSSYKTLQARFYNPGGNVGVITGSLYGQVSYIVQ